jgi:FhaA, N-terminal domain/FHA domain
MGLQQFERRLEGLVEGAFAKAFHGELQPVEIGRRLAREMDLHRTVGVNGLIAPNRLGVRLSPSDLERFESFADALVRELEEAARAHAHEEGYGFVGPVEVTLLPDKRLSRGTVRVSAALREAVDGQVGAVVLPDGRRIGVGDRVVTIGRLPECVVVLGDPNVSRRHAEIRRLGREVVVLDLGSTNGTQVNGTRTAERRLADGDQITVGTTTLRFEAS